MKMEKKEINTSENKNRRKEKVTTIIMLSVLIITTFAMTGCGACLSCVCPGCDGKPDLPTEDVPLLIAGMEDISCLATCTRCFGCQMMQYSESNSASCWGCYDVTYRGCTKCDVTEYDLISMDINATKIVCDSCYCVTFSDDRQTYGGGCLFK